MRRIGWLAALAMLTAPCCNRDINDQTVRIAVTSRVSLNSSGVAGDRESFDPAVSADGRFVVFTSSSGNLSSTSNNGFDQVYLRDLSTGLTEMISVNNAGTAGNANSARPSVSADGTRVAFLSSATNLVGADANGSPDVFVRKRDVGQTVRASEIDGGGDANQPCISPMISANGRYVVFSSKADNLIANAFLGSMNIFRRDLENDLTELVSVNTIGEEPDNDSTQPSISADGLRVAFVSIATDISADPDLSPSGEIYVSDMTVSTAPVVTRISHPFNPGVPLNNACADPAISGDGTRVAFVSVASNLLESDLNGFTRDIIVGDVSGGPLILASRNSAGPQGSLASVSPVLSHSGRYLAFGSLAPNLVDDDFNGRSDVFWRDLESGRTVRVSVNTGKVEGNSDSGQDFSRVALSADGARVWFTSDAGNLIGNDINGVLDVFERGPLY